MCEKMVADLVADLVERLLNHWRKERLENQREGRKYTLGQRGKWLGEKETAEAKR